MRIAETTPDPNLAPIILWQYDKAENLQRLVWKRELVSTGEDEAAELQQTGLAQRIAENSKSFYDDFFTYCFDAINLAIEQDIDALGEESETYRKVVFGLTLWSSLLGVSRPQYTEGTDVKNVRLRTWARFLKATFFKLRMNGSLYDINRYMKILMPEIDIAVSDGGLKGDWIQDEKMSLTYSFQTDAGLVANVGYRMEPYVQEGSTVSFSIVLTMSVDTSSNTFKSILATPYLRVVSQDGVETVYVGSSGKFTKEAVGATYKFVIDDITQQLPEEARVYVSVEEVGLEVVDETVSGATRKVVYLHFDGDTEGHRPDSKVTPVKDQNGRVVAFEFADSSDPLMGLPDWTAYIASDYPEYAEMLKIPGILPYPAGVNDGNSETEIQPTGGKYLGIVDSDESVWTTTKNWAKYTLDHSILLPDDSINPPLVVEPYLD